MNLFQEKKGNKKLQEIKRLGDWWFRSDDALQCSTILTLLWLAGSCVQCIVLFRQNPPVDVESVSCFFDKIRLSMLSLRSPLPSQNSVKWNFLTAPGVLISRDVTPPLASWVGTDDRWWVYVLSYLLFSFFCTFWQTTLFLVSAHHRSIKVFLFYN